MANKERIQANNAELREAIEMAENLPDAGGGGTSVQSDWNQTDETAADFIKNKPFGDYSIVLLEEQELPFDAEMGGMMAMVTQPIQNGDRLNIVYDGVHYECEALFIPASGVVVFGNLAFVDEQIDTGEPFLGAYMDGAAMLFGTDEASHTVKIVCIAVETVPDKYTNVPKLYIKPADTENILYTDTSGTTKATINDLPDHAEFSVGLVTEAGTVLRWYKPIMVGSKVDNQFNGYGIVFVMNGSEILELRTAEYTPTT